MCENRQKVVDAIRFSLNNRNLFDFLSYEKSPWEDPIVKFNLRNFHFYIVRLIARRTQPPVKSGKDFTGAGFISSAAQAWFTVELRGKFTKETICETWLPDELNPYGNCSPWVAWNVCFGCIKMSLTIYKGTKLKRNLKTKFFCGGSHYYKCKMQSFQRFFWAKQEAKLWEYGQTQSRSLTWEYCLSRFNTTPASITQCNPFVFNCSFCV